jgi:hypothetical protein
MTIDSNGIDLHGDFKIEDVPTQVVAFARWLQLYLADTGIGDNRDLFTAGHYIEIKAQAKAHGLELFEDGALRVIGS